MISTEKVSSFLREKDPDKVKPGDEVRIVGKENDIHFGIVSWECSAWREVQIDNEFKIFFLRDYKFYKSVI